MEQSHEEKKLVEALLDYQTFYDNYAQVYQDYARKVHNMINGNVDWGNKQPHNAKIHLNKLGVALDAWKATAKRGLMNFDEWMKVVRQPLMKSEYMDEHEAKRMVELLLRNEDPKVKVADCLGLGFVENLCTLKVVTSVEEIKGPGGKKYKSPRTSLVPLDIWDFGMDPDCVDFKEDKPLFRFQKIVLPKFEVMRHASEEGSPDKPYLKDVVSQLQGSTPEDKTEQDEAKGKQIFFESLSRKKLVTLYEFHGTVLNEDGDVMEYDGVLLEDVRITMSEGRIIDKPVSLESIPAAFVSHKLLRNNKDILGRARGHAGYEINHILDEYASAMADAGIKAASNMTVYKPDHLIDPEEAAGGFTYDSNIAIMPDADPREVITTLPLGELPPTMFNVYNILDSSFAENLSTNSTALTGSLPGKQVRATEVAAANNTVGALEESILMDVDDVLIEELVTQIFRQGLMLAKHFNDLDLKFIFKSDSDKLAKFKELRKNKSKLWDELAYTFRFKGHGLRGLSNQARVGQMTMNLLTSMLGNPVMLENLERMDWDIARMLEIGVKGMGVDPETLKNPKVGQLARERQNYREMGRGIAEAQGGSGQPPQKGAVAGTQRQTSDVEVGNTGNIA